MTNTSYVILRRLSQQNGARSMTRAVYPGGALHRDTKWKCNDSRIQGRDAPFEWQSFIQKAEIRLFVLLFSQCSLEWNCTWICTSHIKKAHCSVEMIYCQATANSHS